MNAVSAAATDAPRFTGCPSNSSVISSAASPRMMSSSPKYPKCPMRKTFPFKGPCPGASTHPYSDRIVSQIVSASADSGARIAVTVAYGCDLELAQDLMLRAATESPRVLDTPPPNVWLTALGENGAVHDILVWISDPESGVGNVKSDVLNRLWKLFGEHGITVPAPRRDVLLRGGPEPDRR